MIQHSIAHRTRPTLLRFRYDLDAKTTCVERFDLDGRVLVSRAVADADRLLRYPAAASDRWVCAVMHERRWGAPAFIESFGWDDLALIRRDSIQHERLGLSGIALAPDASRLSVDRFGGELTVLDVPSMERRAGIPVAGNVHGEAFEPDGDRLAFLHTDQGSGSALVHRLRDGAAERVIELATAQVADDSTVGAVAFLPGDRLLVWTVRCYDGAGVVAAYRLSDGGQLWQCALGAPSDYDTLREIEDFDGEDFDNRLFNTELALAVEGDTAFMGGIGKAFAVDLATGSPRVLPIESPAFVVRVHECGAVRVALDHLGGLHVLS